MTSDPTARDAALRRMLVATVDTGESPKRARWRLPVAALAVFALAGALTGIAVARLGTSGEASDGAIGDEPFEIDPPPILDDDVLVLGTPFVLTGSEPGSIDLGPTPAHATGLAVATYCLEIGSYRVSLDGGFAEGTTCTEEDHLPGGGSGGVLAFGDHPPRYLSVDLDSGRYAVWAAWVQQPPAAVPSQAQVDAMADGVVTRDEYVAGYQRYVACMADLGFAVAGTDFGEGIIRYTIPGSAGRSGAANRCYDAEFFQVDSTYQVSLEE